MQPEDTLDTRRCRHCGHVFKPENDIASLPDFRSNKRAWKPVKCPNCGTPHRIAKLREKDGSYRVIITW